MTESEDILNFLTSYFLGNGRPENLTLGSCISAIELLPIMKRILEGKKTYCKMLFPPYVRNKIIACDTEQSTHCVVSYQFQCGKNTFL